MSERKSVWRKLHARPRITALVVAFAAALGLTVTSMGAAYASGSNCNYDASGVSRVCTHIDGYSNIVTDAIGSASIYSPGIGNSFTYYSGHVQVINPNGTTLCNSNTVTLSPGAGMSCESPYQGATYTGDYCTILWVYYNGGYHNYGEDCFLVFKS
jgi:hypothetical protein